MTINSFSRLLTFPITYLILTSCSSPNPKSDANTPNRESYELEILDSLVVDYIGMMAWSHISPEGNNFLAIDQQKSDILLIGKNGEIKTTLNKTGDQPDAIGSNLVARPQFRNNAEIALLGKKGLFIFGFDGNLKKSIKSDFDPISNLVIQNADQFQFTNENNAVAVYGSRNQEGSGFYTEASGTKLEFIDIENETFTGILPYPSTSRFNSEETYTIINSIPSFRASSKEIYIAFKNDPKIYQFDLDNTENPKNEIILQIDPFHLMKGKDPKAVNKEAFSIVSRDFTYGAINNIWLAKDNFVVSYSSGLSDEEYEQTTQGITDFQEIFTVTGQKNKSVLAVFDKKGFPTKIDVPDFLGRLEFVDKEEYLWFSPNQNEVERDYEVLFKTRLK